LHIREHLEIELSSKASTAGRLREMYHEMAQDTESACPPWRAVILSGAMDPVRSPEMGQPEEIAVRLLREILAEGQKRGEGRRAFPVDHLAGCLKGLYSTVVRRWAIDLPEPHNLDERVKSAVEFFLRAVEP